jgi:hypothetical protein
MVRRHSKESSTIAEVIGKEPYAHSGKEYTEHRLQKWPGLFEQLFPKDKWSHSWVDVLGKAR